MRQPRRFALCSSVNCRIRSVFLKKGNSAPERCKCGAQLIARCPWCRLEITGYRIKGVVRCVQCFGDVLSEHAKLRHQESMVSQWRATEVRERKRVSALQLQANNAGAIGLFQI